MMVVSGRMVAGFSRAREFMVVMFFSLLATVGAYAASGGEKELGISEYTLTDQPHARQTTVPESSATTDHAQLKELQGPFSSGPEVTRVCIECHNKAGSQFIGNKHWTWEYAHPVTGQQLGKKHLVNNFCTNARGNEGMCAQCHAGYNLADDDFDFSNQENIDCLVCHESTGSYYKTPTTDGNEACSIMFEDKAPIDWTRVAQSVQMPGRQNCGKCHFYGGGGDNVKHGDLSSALFAPDKTVDVHMNAEGLDFNCMTCHVGEGHEWAGSRYQMNVASAQEKKKPGPREVANCEGCHDTRPHPTDSVNGFKLNNHTDKIACETCHIPEFARGGVATMVTWDWRTMGRLENGEGYKLKEYTQSDGHHRATYKSIKGSFTYGENIEPVYAWFDGTMHYTTIDTRFDPASGPVEINSISGTPNDPGSRIYPFKRMVATQPYDRGNGTLVYMELWGDTDSALWGNYDFGNSIAAGMKKFNLPYSGDWDFVETHSYWPINHMVAPAEVALDCGQCHSRDGRLKDLETAYMPGTGSNRWIDLVGGLLILGTLGGVLLHTAIRVIASRRRKK